MATTEHYAHFRIDGSDLTRMIRDRVLDDNPGHAWRIATCLGNDADDDRQAGVADAALAVLNGTKRLVGDEKGMKLVKEHIKVTKKYLDDVSYLYAGRIRVHDKWYRPVAYVTDCGPRDMRNDHGVPVLRMGNNKGYTGRAWHYAGRDEIVAEHAGYPDPDVPSIKREVIFQLCGERPHWLGVPCNAQAALDEFLAAGRRLEERSHSRWYGTTADEIWADADNGSNDPAKVDVGSKAIQMRGERVERERKALKKGDLGAMNARLNAELELAKALDEDDRPEVQALRADMIKRACAKGPGVGAMAEMLDEFDPQALTTINPHTAYEKQADRLERDYKLAQEIEDEAAREAAEDQIEAERETLRQRRLDDLRAAILKQADGDLLDLSWDAVLNADGAVRVPAGSIKVPRAPFLRWAFARLKMFEDQMPPWQNISPPGLKMMNDDPNHTDWIIGAGLDPTDRALLYYPGPVNDAALKLSSELQDRFDRPKAITVIVDGPWASGTVVHGQANTHVPPGSIVVLPNLHPRYLKATIHAAAIITEAGGATAHLAQVGRDRLLPIVLIEGARQKYPIGISVTVSTATRTVMEL